jgi:hypothetical protein
VSHMIFRVEYTELASGYRVEVDAGEAGQAAVVAGNVRTVLRMASAFMFAVVAARPDPLDEQFRLPSAPDGPEDRG